MVLNMATKTDDVRSEAVGWTCNDSSLLIPNKPIGMTPGVKFDYAYPTVMHAMHDGWKMLAPPEKFITPTDNGLIEGWYWWLVKDSSSNP